ncbi:unnamed protein product [Calypogeia fissa]
MVIMSHGSEQIATYDNLWDVLAAIARDTGYHVSMEQTYVLPAVDGILDQSWRALFFHWLECRHLRMWWWRTSRGPAWFLWRPTSLGMRLLTWPDSRRRCMPFAITGIYFTPSRLRFLGRFTWPGPVFSIFDGPLHGAVAVPPGLGGYSLS